MDGLYARGHQVSVLTTQPDKKLGVAPIPFSYPVIRVLHGTRSGLGWAERLTLKKNTNRIGVALIFLRQIYRDLHDLRVIDKVMKTHRPDVIYLGHIRPLSANILPYLATSSTKIIQDDGGKTVECSYEEPGLWFRFLSETRPRSTIGKLFKRGFISCVSALSKGRIKKAWMWPENINVFFNNNGCYQSFLSKQIPHNCSTVIHSGLDTEQFSYNRAESSDHVLRIIVPGRIEPNKGQLDAISLSADLKQKGVEHRLIIVGDPWKKDYLEVLEKAVSDLDLMDQVQFLPMQGKAELVDLYHQADICYFSSYHRTGFSRVPLEAMACGCLVISYGNEGSSEIIRNAENGYLVETGNWHQVLELLHKLSTNQAEISKIAESARRDLEQNYSLSKYVDEIESLLKWTLSQN